MSALLDEIRARLTHLFEDIANGDVAAPAARFRLEGLLEAAVIEDIVSRETLVAMMDSMYQEIFGEAIAVKLGDDWQQWHPFPEIPAFAARAPVSPSTLD